MSSANAKMPKTRRGAAPIGPSNNNQAPPNTSSRKRRRGRKNTTSDGVTYSKQGAGVSNNAKASTARDSMRKLVASLGSAKVSADGMAFLKCAFAPPDFSGSKVLGVPDEFNGKSLIKKHRFVDQIAFNTGATNDTYLLLLPVPGVAYFRLDRPANTPITSSSQFIPVAYSDFTSVFGANNNSASDQVAKFRFVSNHLELIPTINAMNWSGAIQAWKFPVTVAVRPNGVTGGTPENILSIAGLESCNSGISDRYSGPFNLGVYTAGYNNGAKFDFTPTLEGITNMPVTINPQDFGQLYYFGAPTTCFFNGLDNNFDGVIIKISGMTSNNNTAIIKTWACVEYQVSAKSTLYEYQTFSPCDPQVMALYRKIINELPVGVSFLDNENFWRRVLSIIKSLSAAGSALPGPYGMASGGVNTISSALEQMFF
jgi:hypothetical protein